ATLARARRHPRDPAYLRQNDQGPEAPRAPAGVMLPTAKGRDARQHPGRIPVATTKVAPLGVAEPVVSREHRPCRQVTKKKGAPEPSPRRPAAQSTRPHQLSRV